MTKSRKSKILALALCAGVMSGIYASPALAFDVWNNDTLGYQEGTTTTTTGTTLKNPEIHHQEEGYEIPGGSFDRPVHENGDETCEESADRITIGDINKVKNDLVDNDKQNAEAIDNLETKVDGIGKDVTEIKEQIENIGEAADTDTFVKDGTYEADQETGNVTMDVYDKNGDTGKDVTITGLASDSELAAVDEKAEQAGKDAAAAQSTANEALTAAGTAQATAEKAQAAAEGAVVIAEEGDNQVREDLTNAYTDADNQVREDLTNAPDERIY